MSAMDTKITRLRNLLTPMKNFIAMVNANNRGECISTFLLKRELDRINKYSDEIWAIIAEIPNEACEGNEDETPTEQALNKHDISNSVICYTCNVTKGTKPKGENYCNMCDHYF